MVPSVEFLTEARALLAAGHPRPAAAALRSAAEHWLRTVYPNPRTRGVPTPTIALEAVAQGRIDGGQCRCFKAIWRAGTRAAHGACISPRRAASLLCLAERLFAPEKGGEA
jgi:hypothetical protein